MVSFIIILTELLLLYFISQKLTKNLFLFTYLLFRNKAVAVNLITFFYFPGTIIHELAHLFTAEVLGVHTGRLTLIPESIEGSEIKTGSVAIAKSDPFRRYIIGLAPTIVGIPTLAGTSWWIDKLINDVNTSIQQNLLFQSSSIYLLFLAFYILFAVSNTMFSSSQDLKDFLPFAITVGLFVATGYIVGIRLSFTGSILNGLILISTTLQNTLGVVLGFNFILLVMGYLLIRLIQHLLKIHIETK